MSYQFRIVKDEPVDKEVEVITSNDRIDSEADRIAGELRKDAQIDGFRKGKAPIEIIKSKFKTAIVAEGMKKIVSEAITEILKEKDWQLARITDIKIDDDDPTKFTLKLETLPQFEISEYKGIEVVSEDVIEESKLLEAKINELRETKATIRVVDRPAHVGDLLLIDLRTPKNRLENSLLELGDRSLPDEMNEGMVGLTKGATKEFDVKTGDDTHETWFLKVKEVKEKILPLDEELSRQLGFTSIEEMQEELRSEVKEDLKRIGQNQLKDKIAQYLIERHKFPLPEGLVEEEYRFLLNERKEEDTPSNRERFIKTAEDRVRLTLVITRIAEKEEISIKDEEIDKYLTEYATSLNYPKDRIDNLKGNDQVRASITTMLLRDRVLDNLLSQAKVTKKEKIVSPWSKDDNRSIRNRADRPGRAGV